VEGNHGGKGTGAGARRNLEMMTGTWRVLRGRERVTDRWALFRPCREGNYSFFFFENTAGNHSSQGGVCKSSLVASD
jgi:hypothetical protein